MTENIDTGASGAPAGSQGGEGANPSDNGDNILSVSVDGASSDNAVLPGNNESPNWMGSLGDEYKGHKSLSEYKDLNGLAKSYIELQKMIGDRVKIPGEGSTPEEMSKFYSKLGRPEQSDKYEYTPSEDIPQEIRNDGVLNKFKEKAFELGLNSKQFSELAKFSDEMNKDTFLTQQQQNEDLDKQFAKQMTEAFGDKKQEAFDRAVGLFQKYLSKEEAESLMKLDNNTLVGLVKTLNSISSEYMSEDAIAGKNNAISSMSTKDELNNVRKKLKAMSEFDSEYKKMNSRKHELLTKLYG